MGDSAFLLEILFFGAVAVFLIHRLWSVLGRRHGEEQQRSNPFQGSMSGAEGREDDRVVTLPDRGGPDAAPPVSRIDSEEVGLNNALTQIKLVEPGFDDRRFLEGARGAFGMIVEAFSAGDLPTLEMLLAPDLFDTFRREIERRADSDETLETEIRNLHNADIVQATLNGTALHLTVRFVSEQLRVLRSAEGTVLDGDPDQPIELVDLWTFSRNIQSPDPNWELVETRVEG